MNVRTEQLRTLIREAIAPESSAYDLMDLIRTQLHAVGESVRNLMAAPDLAEFIEDECPGGEDELAALVLLGVTEIWNIMDRDLAADVHDFR